MIVYYDPDTFEIRGLSRQKDLQIKFPCFETDDPIAEKIFLGQEKILKYIAVVRPGSNRGVIKLRLNKSSTIIPISDRIYKVPKDNQPAEIVVKQYKHNKTIEVSIVSDSKNWWKDDPLYSNKQLMLIACLGDDPYKPLWIKSFSNNDLESSVSFSYQGRDDFTIYTPKLFYTYSHYEVASI